MTYQEMIDFFKEHNVDFEKYLEIYHVNSMKPTINVFSGYYYNLDRHIYKHFQANINNELDITEYETEEHFVNDMLITIIGVAQRIEIYKKYDEISADMNEHIKHIAQYLYGKIRGYKSFLLSMEVDQTEESGNIRWTACYISPVGKRVILKDIYEWSSKSEKHNIFKEVGLKSIMEKVDDFWRENPEEDVNGKKYVDEIMSIRTKERKEV